MSMSVQSSPTKSRPELSGRNRPEPSGRRQEPSRWMAWRLTPALHRMNALRYSVSVTEVSGVLNMSSTYLPHWH